MDQFLKECRAYCVERGMKHSTFSTYAAGDGKFMQRLEEGGQCLPSTMDRVRSYMADHPATDQQTQQGAA